ncbi:MAG TPA: tetratricopeptide repeat protein [Candidatus Deferrimicrobiaceae bacterium]|nr:tetratricopeptide repeat protein [Candidatus Deferrimicrobiaceae bacterium]
MPRPRTAAWAVPVGIAFFTAAVFLPVLRAGFVDWDDPTNFLENPYYRGLGWRQLRWMLTANVMGHWIPVTWLTLGADFAVWGMNPFGYHLTNLLLHTASAVLFYFVSRRLLGLAMPATSPGLLRLGAAAAALFFAVHPLRVESVAWITERRDLTSGLFFLLTILAYLKAHERPPAVRLGFRLAALGAAALALASKSIVMGLPLVLLILDVYPLGRLGPRVQDWWSARAWPVWREKIPFALLAVGTGAAAYLVQRSTGYLTPADPLSRIGMVAYNVWFHVWKTVAPLNLGPIYELPLRVNPLELPYLLSAAGGLAITAAAWLLRRRWPAGPAIWAFYLVMLAPVSGVVHTGNHLGADRNTYVPCAAFALLVGALAIGVVQGGRRRRLRRPIVAMALGVMGIWIAGLALTASVQSSVWHDSETLWRYAIEVDPGCAICFHNLGVNLSRRGDLAEAQAFLERAIALRPDQSEFHGNYGPVLIQMGRRPEGLAKLRYRLGHNPRDVNTRVNLGIALIEDGRPADAIAELEQALRVKPDSVPALNSLGRALLAEGRVEPARGAFERAIAIQPADPVAHLGLARAHLARGDRAAAREQIPVLQRLDPRLARMLEQEIR